MLDEILNAIRAEPAGETRDALTSAMETAKSELTKPEAEGARIKTALDTVDQTVKKGGGILEGGEKIAGLLYRAYTQLSSLF